MSGLGEKIKEKLHLGHHHDKEEVKIKTHHHHAPDAAGHRTTAAVGGHGVGEAETVTHETVATGPGVTTATRVQTPANTPTAKGDHAVCGQKTFTTVEDRAVEKDVIERVIEHHPVEKKFIVETRPAGEHELHDKRQVESVGVREEIKKVAPKTSPCEGGPVLEVQK